mmetsp:Transcript_13794/g.42940  ORF Transcript_13794/g.42940 Transcript_13794/m.42940 type:complete len:288 (-) Transcript_13794:1577-2440(-)|eukprot:CAMPEP_0174844532 /NCGR_PEP_ID=MMETSP1114-20130205/11151_1 /TAXON_ID=312471 /ORGANISM="Neobodo designis, Strain CCAP 1951/1" /LENGTH=287 /DNA_ID=CAMNT_0016078769 /DNA_START=425 /DNA_END=1288 /DNA_ORIENTATION=+
MEPIVPVFAFDSAPNARGAARRPSVLSSVGSGAQAVLSCEHPSSRQLLGPPALDTLSACASDASALASAALSPRDAGDAASAVGDDAAPMLTEDDASPEVVALRGPLADSEVELPKWPALAAAFDHLDDALRAAHSARFGTKVPVSEHHHAASDDASSCFYSSAVPDVSLSAYAHCLGAHLGYGAHGINVAAALLVRCARAGARVCALTAHRVLLACIVVGGKANYDVFVGNRHLADLASVELSELNALEAALFERLGFRAVVLTNAELAAAPDALCAIAASAVASL